MHYEKRSLLDSSQKNKRTEKNEWNEKDPWQFCLEKTNNLSSKIP